MRQRLGLLLVVVLLAACPAASQERPLFTEQRQSFAPGSGAWIPLHPHQGDRSFRAEGLGEDACLDWSPGEAFSFPFDGQSFSTVRVCTNGALGLVPENEPAPDNAGCGEGVICWNEANGCVEDIRDRPGYWLFPRLQDLGLLTEGADVLAGLRFLPQEQVVVVQWSEISPYNDPAATFTFQVQLRTDGEIRFLYHQARGTTWNEGGSVGLISTREEMTRYQQLSCLQSGLTAFTQISLSPNPEACDFWYADCDGDAFYRTPGIESCLEPPTPCTDNNPPDGGWSLLDPGANADCDDEDPAAFTNQTWYPDCDGDAVAASAGGVYCGAPDGTCNDGLAPDGGWDINPGTDCDDEDPAASVSQTWYPDCDGDGYSDTVGSTYCGAPDGTCTDGQAPDGGWNLTPGTDCDDEDPTEFPGQVWYADCDGDGAGRDTATNACDAAGADAVTPCADNNPPDGGWSHAMGDDCDDEDSSEYPGQSWYPDCDNDSHESASAISACDLATADAATPCNDANPPDGGWSLAQGDDCDDEDSLEYPGQSWYADCDGDSVERATATIACDLSGANAATPCNDSNPPDGGWALAQGDDCDDEDAGVFAEETYYPDCDGDGVMASSGMTSCGLPASPCNDANPPDGGWSTTQGNDCDDEDPSEFPGQIWYPDCDSDSDFSFTAVVACDVGAANAAGSCIDALPPDGGWSHSMGNDCDDEDNTEFTGQAWYADCDNDTVHSSTTITACDQGGAESFFPCLDFLTPDGGWSHAMGDDCNDEDSALWSVPNAVTALAWVGPTLEWTAPSNPGATSILYDVIVTTDPADLIGAASSCDGFDLVSASHTPTGGDPAPGAFLTYIAVPKSGCGQGSPGTDSTATPRTARSCP